MKTLRTPDKRFENLEGYPFEPHYVEVDDPDGGHLRMHYVDEGPADGPPVLLLHGEPTWSYLYRKMIPGLVSAGHRVIAPDQIGFGRSDKPTEKTDYTVARHVGWIRQCITSLDLRECTFFGQDWGSLIGLTAVLHEEERFRAIVAANAALPDPSHFDRMLSAQKNSPDPGAFQRWQEWIADREEMAVGRELRQGLVGIPAGAMSGMTDGEVAAYDAPFPDGRYQAGVLVFPSLADPTPDAIALYDAAWRVLEKWEKPFVTAYGKADPVLGYFDVVFQEHVPGATGQPHRVFPEGTHFIQEEEPEALVDAILHAAS